MPYPQQFAIILRRALKDSWRNSNYNGSRILAGAGLALFFGLLYSVLDMGTFQGVQSAMGAVLAAMGFQGVLFFSLAIPIYIGQRAALYRERDARFFPLWLQATAMVLVEALWTALLTIIFVAIFYPLIGFKAGFGGWGFFALGAYLCILSFVFAALAAAALFPSSIIAQLAGGVFLSVVFLFASIFVPYSLIPVFWRWFCQADFAFHLTRALAVNEFHCPSPGSSANGCQTVTITTAQGPMPMQAEAFVNNNFHGSYGDKWKDIGIALGILGALAAAVVILWQKVNWTKR